MTLKRLMQEPLLHFALLGLAVFAVDSLLRTQGGAPADGAIVVSQARIENLSALFHKTWQRSPSSQELRRLVDDYVLEEALYREGLALGVDEDDTIIRRRVRQKMEFFLDDVVEADEPSSVELRDWLAQNAESYRRPARFSFRQLYLDPERRGEQLQADISRVLATLRQQDAQADPRELGDVSLLEHAYTDARSDRIARDFGPEFAEQLNRLPSGEWSGPVESAYGVHVVRVDARSEGGIPALSDVREEVLRDWRHAQREQASQDFHAEILKRYRVTIAWPDERLAQRDGTPGPGSP